MGCCPPLQHCFLSSPLPTLRRISSQRPFEPIPMGWALTAQAQLLLRQVLLPPYHLPVPWHAEPSFVMYRAGIIYASFPAPSSGPRTAHQAQAHCAARGGHLAIARDAKASGVLARACAQATTGVPAAQQNCWIGLRRALSTGAASWPVGPTPCQGPRPAYSVALPCINLAVTLVS